VRPRLTPARLALAGLILLGVVFAILWVAPAGDTYIFLPDDAHPAEPLVTVAGSRPDDDAGGIFFVDVIVRRASLFERLWPGIREGAELVPAHAVNPTGIPERARRAGNLREMSRSQEIAAAVALRELGYAVEAEPAGAFISQVLPDAPAAGTVHPADVILAVDGNAVRTPSDLRRLVSAKPVGSEVDLRLRRGDGLLEVTVRTRADSADASRSVIGVLVEQEARIDLPVDVEIDTGNVGGPSAGLAFALALLEKLGRDVDRGHRVAVTGELELDGGVEAVGGLEQKTIGARRSGVDVFVVPAGENAAEARRHADGLRIVAVSSFQQALRRLATLPRKPRN
jgi:PDZ domain-containing protein